MYFIDYFNVNPKDELLSAWERVPLDEYTRRGSLREGRKVCVWRVCYHTAAIVLKPALCIAVSLYYLALKVMKRLPDQGRLETTPSVSDLIKLFLTGLVAPFGQILQLFKAAMGILHPEFYFKENELTKYFDQLAAIAEEVECELELIETLKQSSSILARKQVSETRNYYNALFEKDLAIICEKLNEPNLSQDEKTAVLNMFASSPNDSAPSGVYACSPGFGRMLEQICASLNVPKESEDIVPWLVAQYKEEILHQMVMQPKKSSKYMDEINNREKNIAIDPHFANILIFNLGKKIGLQKEVIDKSSQDSLTQNYYLSESEQQELVEQFYELYTEEAIEAYLMERINSAPDGGPGLKNLRNYMIQKLAEQVSDSELESSKKEIQNKFKVSDILADDPSFYVKYHYYLYPDADPSDENASDLNTKGIRAFAENLESNPFDF